MNLSENYEKVNKTMEEACEKAGRARKDVTLLAVSKTKPIEMMEAFAALGQNVFGENHVQEIVEKSALHPEYEYHMIGHLQTNKVKQVVGKVALIHSVDSVHLAEAISKEALKKGLVQDVLIEINVGNEESKYGFTFEEAEAGIRAISALPGLRIRGLMCVAPNRDDPEENRPLFRKMVQFAVDIDEKKYDNVMTDVLSMGMTKDYRVAIEEGATHVRVGTALFGPREYKGV